MYVVCKWLVVAALLAATIGAGHVHAEATTSVALAYGDREGLAPSPAVLVLSTEASPSTLYPFAREGRYRSLPQQLPAPPASVTVHVVGVVPAGTGIRLHVRAQSGNRWLPWEQLEASQRLHLRQQAQAIQLRVILLSNSQASPVVSSLRIEMEGTLLTTRSMTAAPTFRVYATREGLVGRRTANGHTIRPRDSFVALPSWKVLNDRGERDYQVRITYRDRSVVLPVWDVGPWNTRDDYWSTTREMWPDLPRGMPQAQAAVQLGHNGGRDQFGRRPNLPNGIDIADGAFWDDLGLRTHAWVEVTFLWLEDQPPQEQPEPEGGGALDTPPPLPEDAGDSTPPVAVMTAAVEVRAGHYFLRWYGKDEGSGVASYDIQVRHGAEGKWQALLSDEPTEEVLYKTSGKKGMPAFRVRARDKSGNVGDFSAPLDLVAAKRP